MLDISRYPPLLGAVSLVHMARDFIQRRNSEKKKTVGLRDDFYQSVWRQAAAELNLDVGDLGGGILEFKEPGDLGLRFKVMKNYTSLDDPVTLRLAGNKSLSQAVLKRKLIPTPESEVFRLKTIAKARDFLFQSGSPCVVKPASGTGGGQGVTTQVSNGSQLGWAASRAARFHFEIVIERQIPGANYRLLFLDGELLDVIKRNPPAVEGDGKSTIVELIRRENKRRLSGWQVAQSQLRIDQDLRQTLASQGCSLRSRLNSGQRVIVKTVINDNSSEENEVAMGQVCSEIVATGRAAAEALGVTLAGVDVITDDPSRPLESNGGVVLEVNTTPGMYIHKRGNRCPVVKKILQAMVQRTRYQRKAEKQHPFTGIEQFGD